MAQNTKTTPYPSNVSVGLIRSSFLCAKYQLVSKGSKLQAIVLAILAVYSITASISELTAPQMCHPTHAACNYHNCGQSLPCGPLRQITPISEPELNHRIATIQPEQKGCTSMAPQEQIPTIRKRHR